MFSSSLYSNNFSLDVQFVNFLFQRTYIANIIPRDNFMLYSNSPQKLYLLSVRDINIPENFYDSFLRKKNVMYIFYLFSSL